MNKRFPIIKKIFSGLNKLRLIIINVVFFYLLILIFAGISVLEKPQPKVFIPTDAVLYVNPSGKIVEEVQSNTLAQQLTDTYETVSYLSTILDTINYATYDRRITAIVFNFSRISGMSLSSAFEIKTALDKFRESGKPYYAYSSYYNLPTYFAASCADTLCLDPLGDIDFSGLASEALFMGGMYEKTGLQYVTTKAGTYKAAADTYTQTGFSDEVRENYNTLFGSIWNYFVKTVSQARMLPPEVINTYVENPLPALQRAEGDSATALKNIGLITEIKTYREMLESLHIDSRQLISYFDMASNISRSTSQNLIAVINMQGVITGSTSQFSTQTASVDSTIIKRFDEALSDPQVKAIVLRINSGGGEVFASELIKRKLDEVRQQNIPVVVSMAGTAASGAYWIASHSDYIFANPFTVTGSIGVFSAMLTYQKALEKYLGITADSVYAGARPLSPLTAPTESQSAIMQLSVDNIYDKFISTVAAGRHLTKTSVATVAGGRIYSGIEALDINLVDKLGTLSDAAAFAANMANVENDYSIKVIAPPKSFFAELLEKAHDYDISANMTPHLQSLFDLTALARENKFLLYEPFTLSDF